MTPYTNNLQKLTKKSEVRFVKKRAKSCKKGANFGNLSEENTKNILKSVENPRFDIENDTFLGHSFSLITHINNSIQYQNLINVHYFSN